MENKKVRGTRECWYKGIHFRSTIEMKMYILLEDAGLNPEYEKHTFCIWKGKKFSVPCYDLHNNRKLKRDVWEINTYKPLNWKYTPDFVCYVPDSEGILRMMVIEAKGKANDIWPYKKKLFRSWLEENAPHSIFFEVHNQKQMKAAIEVIKSIKQ